MQWVAKYTGILRRLRVTYWLFNLSKLSKLRKNKQLYQQLGINKAVWKEIAHADIKQASADIPWLDQEGITPETIRQHPQFAAFPAPIQQQLLQWPSNGFLLLPGLMTAEAEAINREIETLQQAGKIDFDYTGRKFFNAWKQSSAVNNAFHHPLIKTIVHFIFQKAIIPFQTVNFIAGSGEKAHSDSIHFTTEPLGYLSAMWVALEDIQVGSGELLYYPGSHNLRYVMSENFSAGHGPLQLGSNVRLHYEEKIQDIIRQHNLMPRSFLARKGDVLIWHANLLHAGSPVTDPRFTRKSLVAHYFAQGVLQYHEITQRPAIINTPFDGL